MKMTQMNSQNGREFDRGLLKKTCRFYDLLLINSPGYAAVNSLFEFESVGRGFESLRACH